MPYGRVNATVTETENGRELTIRVLLPEQGEPARSGKSDNLTDPNEWVDVVDEFGQPTAIQVLLTAIIPYRRLANLRRQHGLGMATSPRLVRRSVM